MNPLRVSTLFLRTGDNKVRKSVLRKAAWLRGLPIANGGCLPAQLRSLLAEIFYPNCLIYWGGGYQVPMLFKPSVSQTLTLPFCPAEKTRVPSAVMPVANRKSPGAAVADTCAPVLDS